MVAQCLYHAQHGSRGTGNLARRIAPSITWFHLPSRHLNDTIMMQCSLNGERWTHTSPDLAPAGCCGQSWACAWPRLDPVPCRCPSCSVSQVSISNLASSDLHSSSLLLARCSDTEHLPHEHFKVGSGLPCETFLTTVILCSDYDPVVHAPLLPTVEPYFAGPHAHAAWDA